MRTARLAREWKHGVESCTPPQQAGPVSCRLSVHSHGRDPMQLRCSYLDLAKGSRANMTQTCSKRLAACGVVQKEVDARGTC